jgi:hypothetical protein
MPASVAPSASEARIEVRIVKLVGQLPGDIVTLFPLLDEKNPQLDALLDAEEVAHILGFSPYHFRNVAKQVLPYVKLGHAVRYRLRDVISHIERCTIDERRQRSGRAQRKLQIKREAQRTRRP